MVAEDYESWRHRVAGLEAEKDTRDSRHWNVLEAWAQEFDWRSGAEIGVCRGWTSFHLLNRIPSLAMTLVDQWVVVPDTGVPGFDDYRHMVPEYCARLVKERATRYGGRAQVIHAPSTDAAGQVADASLDFVFIDGDHTEAGATADIIAWAPKVKSGGWVCGHDWDRPEVRRALDSLLPGWEGLAEPARAEDKCWRIPRDEARL